MSALFQNAVTSLRMGIEDFQTGEDDRMISSARNYYAGLLLLAKECLVRAAPNADPMQVIGAKVKPISDGAGGVAAAPDGPTTIGFHDLKKRFSDFGLPWPDGDLQKLVGMRNQLEHLHLKEPVAALAEAIASSFPMVVDFFAILVEDPKVELGDTWDVILERHDAFKKVQAVCLAEIALIDWNIEPGNLDRMSCPNCGSSLIGQEESGNTDVGSFHAKCAQCGEVFDAEDSIRMVVDAAFGADNYIAAKEGGEPVVNDCPNCAISDAYVQNGEANGCIACGFVLDESCVRCGAGITLDEYTVLDSGLCGYCNHMSEKVMRE